MIPHVELSEYKKPMEEDEIPAWPRYADGMLADDGDPVKLIWEVPEYGGRVGHIRELAYNRTTGWWLAVDIGGEPNPHHVLYFRPYEMVRWYGL